MHPQRAARLLATLGGFLLAAVLLLRGFFLVQSIIHYTTLPVDPEEKTSIPAVGRYRFYADGKQVTFEQQIDPVGKTAWRSMPLTGWEISPAAPPADDLRPFIIQDGQLFLVFAGGLNMVNVTPPSTRVTNFARSPDGNTLAYAGLRSDGQTGLYILHTSGEVDWLGDQEGLTDLAWSPDGKNLAFAAKSQRVFQVFRADRSGQQMQQLTSDAAQKSSPIWSPDSKSIAYLVAADPNPRSSSSGTPTPETLFVPTPSPYDTQARYTIALMQADGANQHPLTREAQPIFKVNWINSGKEIAYALRQPSQFQATYLFALNLQTGMTRRVYPPFNITRLDCPARIPRDGSGTVKLSVANTSLAPAEVPVLGRSGPDAFAAAGPRNKGTIHAGTIQAPAGKTGTIEWTITAAPGLETHVSALINIGETLPMDEAHCTMRNVYYGIPNLPFLTAVAPVTAIGMILCIPWLRNEKKRLLWTAWIAAPILAALMIWVEAALVVQ